VQLRKVGELERFSTGDDKGSIRSSITADFFNNRKRKGESMRNHGKNVLRMFGLLGAFLCLGSGWAFAAASAATPELEAKGERIRSQQAQRVTAEERKQAAEALKAERLKIYKAKEAQKAQPQPTTGEPITK
jgi:hypothetical protein